MYCRQCGFNNDKYSKMCKRCGSDLTRPTEDYTPSVTEPGQLRFAPKKESFSDMLKRRFRRLERAAMDRSHLKPFFIAAAVIVAVTAALIIVPRVRACLTVIPDTYGNTACNTATMGAAAVNGDYLYCSQPVGDNPGLYRVRLSTGEPLKISWHILTQVSWYDGWLYGVDETGALIRMSYDGLREQRVIDKMNVKYVSLFNGYVYYIDEYGDIYRAELAEITDEAPAGSDRLLEANVSEMMIFDGMIYYIDSFGMGYEPDIPLESIIDPEYIPGKISWITGKEIPPDYRIDAGTADKPIGNVCRISPEGGWSEVIVSGRLCNLSAHGEYLYYMTQTVVDSSASEYDPGAPSSITIKASSCQFWRFNLVTNKYTRFLDEGTSRTALNVTDDGICFVSIHGDLERCPTTGGDDSLLPTEAVDVEYFAVIDGVVYYTSDSGGRVGWINIDGSSPVTLWEAEWDPVAIPQPSGSDVSD